MLDNSDQAVLARVDAALQRQREYLVGYEKPAEPLAYETIRAFDDIFVRDLMLPLRRVDQAEKAFRNISGWGVNQALRRIVPTTLSIARSEISHRHAEPKSKPTISSLVAVHSR